MKAREIEAQIEIDDRRIRVLAEQSDGRIISGQKGYRVLDRSTSIEEATHSAQWLISQGRKMEKRGLAILRRVHALANGAA